MIAAEVHRIPERAARARTLRLRFPSHPIATIFLIAVSAFVVAPLVSIALIAAQGDSELWPHLAAYVLPVATVNTLLLLAGVALISVVAGVGTAWIVTAYQFPGRNAFVCLLPLPLAFPTYIVAYVYADLLGGLGPVQSALRAAFANIQTSLGAEPVLGHEHVGPGASVASLAGALRSRMVAQRLADVDVAAK